MEERKMKKALDKLESGIEKNSSEYRPASEKKRKRIESILEKSRKTKNINIRISEYDLEKLRERSDKEGIPYQTLVSSILHKYVSDQLVEEKDILKSLKLLVKSE
jgi:predicted DNA binding CopG/RHH family protein